MFSSLRQTAALLCAATVLQGCASNASLYDARNQFYSGQSLAALETLKSDRVADRNRLLAHLDHGLIAHTAGNYQESVNAFLAAKAFLTEIDYVSIREQSTSLVSNDWVNTYKGEYSERLWIHTFQMMNFLLLGDAEAAAVEARQSLELHETFGDALKHDWYSRALMAMSFEAAGKADSAHIEYRKLLDDLNADSGIARRAWQNARKLGREQDADRFKKLMADQSKIKSNNGELIVFLQTGAIPRKIAGEVYLQPDLYASFPVYPENDLHTVKVVVLNNLQTDANDADELDSENETTRNAETDDELANNAKREFADIITTQLVDVSRSALAARGKQIAAKQILRLAAKKELARALDERGNGLGELITAVMYVTEIADTRSWVTLPAFVSMIQIPLSEGRHNLKLAIRNGPLSYDVALGEIDIKSRRTTYRSLRAGPGAPQVEASLQAK